MNEYCQIPPCTDKTPLQLWREDGRCGPDFPLADGRPAECDPDGRYCCDQTSSCQLPPFKFMIMLCECKDCVNYKVVQMIRESGKSCSPVNSNGFLKIACYDESSRLLTFKCPSSGSGGLDMSYRSLIEEQESHFIFTWTSFLTYDPLNYVSDICSNDPHGYQACKSTSLGSFTNGKVFCGGFYCYDETGRARLTECDQDCELTYQYPQTTILCPENASPIIYEAETVPDRDRIDPLNGFKYEPKCDGMTGHRPILSPESEDLFRISKVCDGVKYCPNNADEENCLVSEETEHKCTQYFKKYFEDEEVIVPILNYTRCSQFNLTMVKTREVSHYHKLPYPYCLNYLEQTNCSDPARVGGYCWIGEHWASVSKYMVCFHYDKLTDLPVSLCQDDIQNECLSSSVCEIHKHRMCDGVVDCPDKMDELHDMCQFMSRGMKCERRFNVGRQIEIPIAWILDRKEDCMGGEDEIENEQWRICGSEEEKTKRVQIEQAMKKGSLDQCQNVFMCPGGNDVFVKFAQLCDGIESCGVNGENEVCRISKDSPEIEKSVSRHSNFLDICLGYSSCEMRTFFGPWGDVFGQDATKVYAPTNKVDCTDLFGEFYLYLSCLDLCLNTTCPLNNRTLLYDSCPGQFYDRVYALANNSFLTFVTKEEEGNYRQDYFKCNDNKCINYDQVCDLVNDCEDMSDETGCTNNMVCENTVNTPQQQFVSISQRCDGIYDCSDLSDECNEFCGKRILENWGIKTLCWIVGVLALAFNSITLHHWFKTIRFCESKPMMFTKVLAGLFGLGDFTVGLYLITLSIYDSFVYGDSFCKHQAEWLTGRACAVLGVISTIGSQVSIFAMTALSFVRMVGTARDGLIVPESVDKKSVVKVAGLIAVIILASMSLALVPFIPILEDYFVQGMYYEPEENYRLFLGFPNKVRHLRILRSYFNTTNLTAELSWGEIGEKVDNMFSKQYGTATRRPVHFYGNDGVCLFRYFIRSDDARRSRNTLDNEIQITDARGDAMLWLILVLNLFCFVVISCCYCVINVKNLISARRSGQINNPERLREQKSMQNKIALIILTDFLCWVPFIILCIIHNLGYADTTKWYVNFAMAVLPLNSFINPLIYDKSVKNFLKLWLRKLNIYGYNWARKRNIFKREEPENQGRTGRRNAVTDGAAVREEIEMNIIFRNSTADPHQEETESRVNGP